MRVGGPGVVLFFVVPHRHAPPLTFWEAGDRRQPPPERRRRDYLYLFRWRRATHRGGWKRHVFAEWSHLKWRVSNNTSVRHGGPECNASHDKPRDRNKSGYISGRRETAWIMSLSVDTRLDSMALNSKRPREYIPTEMLEYLIKLKFDRQVKVEPEMKYV